MRVVWIRNLTKIPLCFFSLQGCVENTEDKSTTTTVGPVPIAESCANANQVRCEEGKVTQCQWDVWLAECTPECAALSRSVCVVYFMPLKLFLLLLLRFFLASFRNMIG